MPIPIDGATRKLQRIAWLQAAMGNATTQDRKSGQLAAWHQELDCLMSGKVYGREEIGQTASSQSIAAIASDKA